MPDITMCEEKGCKLKETCYRFKATPNEPEQSYFTETPIKKSKCNYYIKNNLYI